MRSGRDFTELGFGDVARCFVDFEDRRLLLTFELVDQVLQHRPGFLEMDELTSESEFTEIDIQEIAEKIKASGRERVEEELN